MSELVTDDAHERLQRLFDRQLEVGLHHGAQLAVYRDGERVVDFAGGTTGPDGDETTPETRHLVFSCTKPFVGVALHHLVEEGRLDYDDPVVDHWPEFDRGDERKAEITVRHVLSHRTGVPTSEVDDHPEQWGDWDAIVESVEDAPLQSEPGTTAAYHTLNYGWMVGELIRRVSGKPVEAYTAEAVFEPLGMDHTSVGVRDGRPENVATLAGFDAFDRCRDPEEGLGDITPPLAAEIYNENAIQEAVVPAANGISTAHDMARFYACMVNGGELDGTRVLGEETVEAATELQIETADDGTLSRPARYAMGFWRGGTVSDLFGTLSGDTVFGHVGLGSIVGWADPETDIAFAYVTNGIREESYEHAARVNAIADAVRRVYG